MSDQDSERFHSRKHPRLQNYDYSRPNYYFITICTHDKRCIFGSPAKLNSFGMIAEGAFRDIELHFPGVRVDKYVVMPNHVHGIIDLRNGTVPIPTVIGQYKSAVTKRIHKLQPGIKVWQTSFHDHIIRDQKGYEQIWMYIDTNPAKWLDDCFYCEADRPNQHI